MTQPAWFTAAVDQRLALMREALVFVRTPKLIVTPLREPPEGATKADLDRWERACDGCDKDCKDLAFYTGHTSVDVGLFQVVITYGICADCKEGFDG